MKKKIDPSRIRDYKDLIRTKDLVERQLREKEGVAKDLLQLLSSARTLLVKKKQEDLEAKASDPNSFENVVRGFMKKASQSVADKLAGQEKQKAVVSAVAAGVGMILAGLIIKRVKAFSPPEEDEDGDDDDPHAAKRRKKDKKKRG